jgi:alkylation response protein AidB-like acyl-CoA dehydrogenase
MNFDFDDDQQEIRRTARSFLAHRSSLAAVREAAEAGNYRNDLWFEICRLGWPGIAIDDGHGGEGLGLVELAILLEESGYALAGSALLSTTCAAFVIDAAGSASQRARWLPGIASGAATAALGIGERALVADAGDADLVVLVGDDGARVVERAQAAIERVDTVDPTRRYARVTGRGESLPGDPGAGVSRALIAISAELVGVCQRALDMTVEYVKQRKQFGVSVGAFQAVSHKCAEMLLHTEGARSAVYAAAWAADADESLLAEAALLAKIAASDAGREVTSAAIQAHGGIGFTWEADVHWLYKRAQLDALQLGSPGELRARLAQAVGARSHAAGRNMAATPET